MTEFGSLPELIAKRAQSAPEAVYLQHAEERTALTYGEADSLGKRWAYAFHHAGIRGGDTVLTALPPSFDALGTWLGAAWLGAMEVPVNTAYRGRMLEYVLDDSRASLLVVHSDFVDDVLGSLDAVDREVTIVVVGPAASSDDSRTISADTFLDGNPAIELSVPEPHQIAAILYTSGTTGPSKGVLVPWRQAKATSEGTTPADLFDESAVFYSPFPMYHMSGKGPFVGMASVGGSVVIRSRFSTDAFWQDVRDYNVTTTILIGAMINFLLSDPPREDDSSSTLNDAIFLPFPDDLRAFEERFGMRGRTTFNMTETACCIVTQGYELHDSKSCGRVRKGFEARIVDAWDAEVAPSEIGELVLRSDEPWTLMAGYWNKPEATAAAWRNGWLHTGDAFKRDESGNFYFVDRMKDAIRRRGENVSSAEVEAEVNDHPDVIESAAVAVPSEQAEDEIKIFVVVRPGSELTAAELGEFLEPRMARFMVPRYIEFIDSLPKTPTLKVQKAVLRSIGLTGTELDRATDRQASVR